MIDQLQVERLARQYYPIIATAIAEAFGEYMKARALLSQSGVVAFKERTCGSVIHDMLKVKLKEKLASDPDVVLGEFNRIYGMLIQDKVFIRFNKVNDELFSSGAKSQQREKYNNQDNFAGFTTPPTLLYAGYLPDASWTKIKNIYLVCRSGDQIIWNKDLTSEVKQISIFNLNAQPEDQQQTAAKGRVTGRKDGTNTGTDGKTGTNDQ